MKCLKKLSLLFLLFAICIFLLIPLNKCFASVEYELNGNKVQLPDLLPEMKDKHYILVYTDYYPGYQFIVAKDWTTDSIFYTDGGKYIYYDNNASFDYYLCRTNNNELKWEYFGTYNYINYDGRPDLMMFSTDTIYNSDKTTIFYGASQPIFNKPYIVNSLESLSSWKFDNLWVDYGDYDINKTIYLHICKKTVDVSGVNSFYYTDSVIALSSKGKYYESYEDGLVYYFSIPKDNLSFTVSSGDKIIFYLSSSANNLGGPYSSDKPLVDSSIFDTKSFVIGESYTEEDKQKDYQDKISSSLDDQKHAIEENTKTNKSIFEKIGDILSFINPFSENFFGKKLVELILDGLKSLFVPEDGFFDTYFSDLKNWFSDRLGFLWTPFDIIIEILNKILNINFSEPIFHIPEINEPFSGSKLISEYDYNLNSLLDNDVFNNIHNIYLFGVDAVIIFALINLARKKIEEVFSN